jgi:carboxymethylenebutenolidase
MKIDLPTREGVCPVHVFEPEGAGPFPAVLVYMDGIGIRPAMLEIGERLQSLGYLAVVPDLFYRSGPYAPMDAKKVFSDPEARKVLLEKFLSQVTAPHVMSDTAAFLDYLEQHPSARRGGVAVTGYCRGGFLALIAAGTYAERIVAAASFHGSRLADDAPESPHLLAPRMKARIYVAGAKDDPSFPDSQKERLERALEAAGVEHTVETYPAHHGWVLSDTSTHDAACAERHWQALGTLLKRAFAVDGAGG